MIDSYLIATLALTYLATLFLIAWFGDFWLRAWQSSGGRPLIYALSIAVYCTSWTFFGSVGLASMTGYDFLAVYIGPILMFTVGWPILLKVVRIAKTQNITSVADFLAARYGKSPLVAALVTCICVIGLLPYIALQLRAITVSAETMLVGPVVLQDTYGVAGLIDTGLIVTIALAAFTLLFGTRHIDATEHQDGLILAIATESLIKLLAFLAVGVFVVFYAFGSAEAFFQQLRTRPEVDDLRNVAMSGSSVLTIGLLSFICILLLPRQFHVTVVENHSEREIRRARWLLPVYLVLINLFVVPIAAAGLMLIPAETANPDMFVLSVPLAQGAHQIATLAFIGGLSAATAMVVVETVALSIMISNGLIVPWLLRRGYGPAETEDRQLYSALLTVRRVAIVVILLLCYAVYRTVGGVGNLAGIGLIAFAAIAQLGPAFFGGLVWKRATSSGAIAGITVGAVVWAYTLVLPWIIQAGWMPASILNDGPFGIAMLRPQELFFVQFEPLAHSVFWSLGLNVTAYFAVSLLRGLHPIERLQAYVFIVNENVIPQQQPAIRFWRSSITLSDLQSTVARYLGPQRTARAFQQFFDERELPNNPNAEADLHTLRFTERLLSSAVGAPSARLVLSLVLRRGDVANQSALRLLDDATEALQQNRDLLQSALDQVRHGISVFDRNNQLICWNRRFRELLDLPQDLARVGVPLVQVLRTCAAQGSFGDGDIDQLVAERLTKLAVTGETFQEHVADKSRIIEFRTSRMPQGGFVTTYLDITDRVRSANALEQANLTLELRVRKRTAELENVNAALAIAKAKADTANADKTRFIAAASHDILQPMNAARLYTSSLLERSLPPETAKIADSIDRSLLAVEDILRALVDLSRMDAGRLEPDNRAVSLNEMLEQLKVEFEPAALNKGLKFTVQPSSLWVRSDAQLLSRVLQNLVANAVKYTNSGRVLVGARRRGATVEVQVLDTGPGIAADKRSEIFREFHRLETDVGTERGLGLGLSIVERIARILNHPIGLRSVPGQGTCFFVVLPVSAAPAAPVVEIRPVEQIGPLNGTHVLCIDNETAVLDGMETLLRGWQCFVTTATSARQAIEKLNNKARPPDVILADYHLDAGATGPDAIDDVRQHCNRFIAAAVITADHSSAVKRELVDKELTVLRKPVNAGALRALLTALARRQLAAE